MIKQFNSKFNFAVDANDPKKLSTKDRTRIKNLLKAKKESLNNQLVRAIDTRCTQDREALLQTKVRFKKLQEEGSEQTRALAKFGLTASDHYEIVSEIAKLQYNHQT